MEDIVEKLEFGCPFKLGTIGEKDSERAEVWMQEGADEITRLRAEVLRLTALCDEYRGEIERLKGITSTQDMVCAECREISGETALAALTRARSEGMEEAMMLARAYADNSFHGQEAREALVLLAQDLEQLKIAAAFHGKGEQ